MAATTTLQWSNKDKRLVHNHMTHTEQTADRNYIRPDQAKIAAAGHSILKTNISYIESDDSEQGIEEKSEYYCKLINDSQNNSTDIWKAIKATLPSNKSCQNVTSLVADCVAYTTPSSIAQARRATIKRNLLYVPALLTTVTRSGKSSSRFSIFQG